MLNTIRTTTIPRLFLYEVMRDFYHQQKDPLLTYGVYTAKGAQPSPLRTTGVHIGIDFGVIGSLLRGAGDLVGSYKYGPKWVLGQS